MSMERGETDRQITDRQTGGQRCCKAGRKEDSEKGKNLSGEHTCCKRKVMSFVSISVCWLVGFLSTNHMLF